MMRANGGHQGLEWAMMVMAPSWVICTLQFYKHRRHWRNSPGQVQSLPAPSAMQCPKVRKRTHSLAVIEVLDVQRSRLVHGLQLHQGPSLPLQKFAGAVIPWACVANSSKPVGVASSMQCAAKLSDLLQVGCLQSKAR